MFPAGFGISDSAGVEFFRGTGMAPRIPQDREHDRGPGGARRSMKSLTAIPLVRVAALRPVLRSLVQLGVPYQQYLDRVALSPRAFARPESFVSRRQASRFIALVAE